MPKKMRKILGIMAGIFFAGAFLMAAFFTFQGWKGKKMPPHVLFSPSFSRYFSLAEKVQRAREKIKTQHVGFKMCEKKRKGKFLCQTNVCLAVSSREGGEIKFIELSLEKPRKEGFSVGKKVFFGRMSRFLVGHPRGSFVLATKRIIPTPKGAGYVVYTPYSKELDVRAIRIVGLGYLKILLISAGEELKGLRVHSRAFPEKLVADVIPLRIAINVSIIEEVDPQRFLHGNARFLVREILTIFGVNKEESFRRVVSPAGARGQFQFMPSTYARLLRLYPKARLDKDFIKGMTRPLNAAKAALCLMDADLSVLMVGRAKLREKEIAQNLVASYNCGAACVYRALRHGNDWLRFVPRETSLYVKKFIAVQDILYGDGDKKANNVKKGAGKIFRYFARK